MSHDNRLLNDRCEHRAGIRDDVITRYHDGKVDMLGGAKDDASRWPFAVGYTSHSIAMLISLSAQQVHDTLVEF